MKILMTGMTGFIGKHLSAFLRQENHEVWAIVRQTTDTTFLDKNDIQYSVDDGSVETMHDFFSQEKFDGVVHLSSCFIKDHASSDITKLIESNVLFSTHIIEAAANSGVKWFINTGTFWQHYNNQEYSPANLYAATKQAFENIAQYYLETTDLIFVTLKLNDTYGPGDTRPKIFNLWDKISRSGDELDMSGGEQWIDIVYIDDIVSAYSKLIQLVSDEDTAKYKGQSFAVYAKEKYKLKDLARKYSEITNRRLKINWGALKYRDREVMKPWDKGRTIPGWECLNTLEQGLVKLEGARKDA